MSNKHPTSNSNLTNCYQNNAFGNSFFYKTHLKWNNLPFDIRINSNPVKFKKDMIEHYWANLYDTLTNSDDEDLLDTG